jgi:hypothetical protein
MLNKLQHSLHLINRRQVRVGAIAFALLGTLTIACSPNQEVRTSEPAESPVAQTQTPVTEDEQNVTIDEVTDNLEELEGKTVSVRSEVETTEDPNTFLLTDDDLFAGEDVLIVNASGVPFVLPTDEDVEVQVTGEVRRFVYNDVREDVGLTAEPNYYTDYEDQPVIFANSIALSPEPETLTENPDRFYGETIAVEGEISEVTDPSAFILSDPGLFEGEGVLVLNSAQDNTLEAGETVVVTGELRPFVVADIERDYDLTWDLDLQRELEAEYREKPVFVAREVYPSAQ